MERTPNIRRSFTAMLAVGLVFALAACGSALDAEFVEELQEVETIVEAPGDGDITYDQQPTIDGETVTEDDLVDGIPDGAVLEGDFSGWNFDGIDFKDVSLKGARFNGASFVGAKFSGSTFHGGEFVGADFTGARLMGADLSYGDFTGAIFTDAMMPGASFKRHEARFGGATWTNGVTVCSAGAIGGCD